MRLPRMIQMQPRGSLPPLFWIDAGPVFRALAEALGPDQPFLGIVLHPHDLQELGRSFQLADVAARHVQTIRAFQPSGPYFVGGWCTSGIVAYEVASQLIADGHQVGLLTMVHSTNPVHFRRIGRTALGISKLKYHLIEAVRQRSETRWRYVLERFDGLLQSLSRSLVNSDRPTTFDVMLDEAALDYVPQPYQGDVALFQPAARPDVLDYRPGWAEVVRGEFAAFDIPGAHRTMLEHPNVQKTAARLRACLNSARTDMQFRQRPAN
jgi:thioesterase domain-containing protein